MQKHFVLPLPKCREFLAKLRSERRPVLIGEEPYQFSAEYGRISLGKNKIDLLDSLCNNREKGSGESRDFEVQSIVGPVVNIVNFGSDASEGMAHASGWQKWISWNLKEDRRAELTDLFDSESVLNALKSDKVMRQRFFKGRTKELEKATDILPLVKPIQADPRQQHNSMGWQIVSYDQRTHIANVQMGFYGNCCNSAKVFKIGLNLKVKPEYQDEFKKSASKSWIGLSRQKNTAQKKSNFERAFESYVDLTINADKVR